MVQNTHTKKASLHRLRRAVQSLTAPESYFSGLTLRGSMQPENIIFFNRTDSSALHSIEGVSVNFHHRYELVVLLEKSGAARIGDVSYHLHPGEAALIFPNQFHHFLDVDAGALDWLFITFELAQDTPIAALKNAPRILDATHLKLLGLLLDEYVNPADGEQPDPVEISCLLARLLRRMVPAPLTPEKRRNIHSGDDVRDVILENINCYVRTHLTEPTTIAKLADALGYSVSYVRTVFRTRLGVSLGKYIRESRLSHASTLLGSTELNVSEVAERAGFDSLFVFSRAFKKAFGVSPKVYSQRVSGGRTGRSVKRKAKRKSALK